MTSSGPQDKKWLTILRDINLDTLFAELPQREFLFKRLGEFGVEYSRKVRGLEEGVLPATASLTDVLAEYDRNPHRVNALVEAVAFQCSPETLVLIWMTLLGARIEKLTYEYTREQSSSLKTTLVLPDGHTELEFRSLELWDVALFRIATLSKVDDDRPIIEDFYPIWIPPPHPWNHDYYVSTELGNFGAVDVAPKKSQLPRWEVHEVFSKQSPRAVGSIDLHANGPAFSASSGTRDRVVLERAWSALVEKYGEAALKSRRLLKGSTE